MAMSESGIRLPAHFEPMRAAGTRHFIERTYRESGTLQWVRETVVNALEAGATRIDFGIEWQAVENTGTYRRVIADNGKGMTSKELVTFFNTFGGGGKPIGGVHEHFGVGAKTSLLPWNRYGMVVVSWVDCQAAMIWVQQHPETQEYGLRVEEVTDDDGNPRLEAVYAPYADLDHGCDWSLIKPDWIDKHGTVIVLLGNGPDNDTVQGDPNRQVEADIKAISSHLNRRLWEVPNGIQITGDELRHEKRTNWPTSRTMATTMPPTGQLDRRTNRRSILGARHFITYPRNDFSVGKLAASGTVPLSDGSEIDWYLWKGDRPQVHMYAAKSGYVAALYRNELYNITRHHSTFRMFGVSESQVRQRLWLIIRPQEFEKDKRGVYPRTDRNELLLKGGPTAGGALPIADWAAEFAENMPQAIFDAISQARGGEEGTIDDDIWRKRLAERFGSRWKVTKLRMIASGSETVEPVQAGSTAARRAVMPVYRSGGGGTGGRGDNLVLGARSGTKSAVQTKVTGGIPSYRFVCADELGAGMLAGWHPNDPNHPEGVVLINKDHPVLRKVIEYWQAQFADHYAEAICDDVMKAYAEIAVAKIAHSEWLRGIIQSDVIDGVMRSEEALTMALLGLMAEEMVIAARVRGKYRRPRRAA